MPPLIEKQVFFGYILLFAVPWNKLWQIILTDLIGYIQSLQVFSYIFVMSANDCFNTFSSCEGV